MVVDRGAPEWECPELSAFFARREPWLRIFGTKRATSILIYRYYSRPFSLGGNLKSWKSRSTTMPIGTDTRVGLGMTVAPQTWQAEAPTDAEIAQMPTEQLTQKLTAFTQLHID